MADTTISGLSAALAANRTWLVPIAKPGAGENARVTLEQIVDLVSDTISNALSVANAASNKASATAPMVIPTIIWLASLASWPLPAGPT